MSCYHVDNGSSDDRCPTEARASWPVYTDFSLGAGQAKCLCLSDRSLMSRSPAWAYASFSTDIDGHFLSMLRSGGRFTRCSTVGEPVIRAHARISRVGDSGVSGDVRRSLLGRLVDFRIPPHIELNTERANIHNRMNKNIKTTCHHVHC